MPGLKSPARTTLAVLALAAGLGGCYLRDDRPIHAITGAMLLDGTPNVPIADAVVVVYGGKIVALGPAGQVRVPADAQRVDVPGRFLYPLNPEEPLRVGGPADLIVCAVNPARDPEYPGKVVGRMEEDRWTQTPH